MVVTPRALVSYGWGEKVWEKNRIYGVEFSLMEWVKR